MAGDRGRLRTPGAGAPSLQAVRTHRQPYLLFSRTQPTRHTQASPETQPQAPKPPRPSWPFPNSSAQGALGTRL